MNSMAIVSPTLLVLLLIILTSGSLAHVLWGTRWIQLPLFLLAASVGCMLVYASGIHLPLGLVAPAGVPVLETMLGALLCAIIASHLRV